MTVKPVPKPTEAELAILQVLWDQGPSTVREVHERASGKRNLQYTTTLKLLQIMTAKGLTERDTEGRSHVYRARQKREETQRRLVDDLLERAFGGSAAALVMQALQSRPASRTELEQISRLIEGSRKATPKKEKNRV
jgi:predicted transcriptional regulator